MASQVGHYKVVYPANTPRGVKRTSWKASVYLVLGDQEIKLPGITGVTLAANMHDADRVTLEGLGTVEIVYATEPEADVEEEPDDMDELIAALRTEQE